MEQKLGQIFKESKSLKELYTNLRKNDKDFIGAGYCVDMGGNCDPEERCYCRDELEKSYEGKPNKTINRKQS